MKLVTTKFKSGGLHEKHVVAAWNLGNHLYLHNGNISVALVYLAVRVYVCMYFVVRCGGLWAQCEAKQGVYGRRIRWVGYMTHVGDKRNA